MLPDLPPEQLITLARRMLLIRRFEEKLVGLFAAGEFVGHYHLYIGEEATGVPAIDLLAADDYIFSTHRNHGHNLARGADPKLLMAEILGRASGVNQGKGGTLHLCDPSLGILHTSGIVGGSMPLAAGCALAAKQRGSGQITLCLFGDGALEEGAAYEALNYAALWKLPVVFVCENNGLEAPKDAPGSWVTSLLATQQLGSVAAALGMSTAAVDGGDAGAVWSTVGQAVARARKGDGPSFIEAGTIRWPGNFGLWPDLSIGATDITWAWGEGTGPPEFERWFRQHDPLYRYLRELLAAGAVTQESLRTMDDEAQAEVDAAEQFALSAPLAEVAAVRRHVFVEEGA